MKLTDIDGQPVFVRASDIVIVSCGSQQRPTKVLGLTPKTLQLANGHATGGAVAEPQMRTIPALVLHLRGIAHPQGVADTPENRSTIEEAMNSAYAP